MIFTPSLVILLYIIKGLIRDTHIHTHTKETVEAIFFQVINKKNTGLEDYVYYSLYSPI